MATISFLSIISIFVATIIWITAILIFLNYINKLCVSISPSTNLLITNIERTGNMERIKLAWTPSLDTFVESQKVFTGIDGVTPAQNGVDLPSSADSVILEFPTDAPVVLFVRTVGDNGSIADSELLSFIADNEQNVRAATGLSAVWQEHVD